MPSDSSTGDTEQEVRREAEMAAKQTRRQFEHLRDRLEELAHIFDDDQALDAFQSVEDLVCPLDDALSEAQEAVRDD